MQSSDVWAIGIDLGGTKTDVGLVESGGHIRRRLRRVTPVKGGPTLIKTDIVAAVHELLDPISSVPVGVGVGLAGQIDSREGNVIFAPNLDWRNVPFQRDLSQALGLPVVITNDVRAITWGEWLHGAGQGCNDLICLFVGTGIGGGIVSEGKVLSGSTNAAGEIGHLVIDWNGPSCTCGNRGCLEAFAGGWAVARHAQEIVARDPSAGSVLLEMVGGKRESITAETVARAAHAGDPLAKQLVDRVAEALIAGSVSLIHAFNPSRLILGGGVIEGIPELAHRVTDGVRQRALVASTKGLEILPSKLKENAGIVGAAMLAIHTFGKKDRHHG